MRRHLSSIGDSDIVAMARMLQKQGRGSDRILAHINAGEAKLLKKYGGRGSRNPITGLLEFDDGMGDVLASTDPSMGAGAAPAPAAPVGGSPETVVVTGTQAPQTGMDTAGPIDTSYLGTAIPFQPAKAPAAAAAAPAAPAPAAPAPAPAPAAPAAPTPETVTIGANAPQGGDLAFGPAVAPGGNNAASWSSNLKNWVQNNQTLMSLGLLGGLGLFGAKSAAGASKAGGQLQSQLANVALPLQAQGQQELATTQAGGLTPSSMEALNAVQAQLGQAAAAGAISAAQVAQSISRTFASLLQSQLQDALTILNQADTLLSNAYIQGYQANATAQANTSNFYMNLANLAARLPGIGSPSIAAATTGTQSIPATAPATSK